jgi:glycosyltransferase involved in cell wall biosynthesis
VEDRNQDRGGDGDDRLLVTPKARDLLVLGTSAPGRGPCLIPSHVKVHDLAKGPRLAIVLWKGDIGGAEMLFARLAERLRGLGADVKIVFIGTPCPLAERLSGMGVPYLTLGFGRGRGVIWHPRQYAAEVARSGPDGVLLVARGFIASALRLGGYRAPIVAVEHGALLDRAGSPRPPQLLRRIGAVSGAWASDVEVGVSEFMLDEMRRHPHHARDIRLIRNGIDPSVYAATKTSRSNAEAREPVVAFAGRLIPGKGADCLIQAVARLESIRPIKVRIAGDGPELARLEALARSLGVAHAVQFLGRVDNMPAFWQASDVVAVPPDTFTESFSMVTLEGMSCGKPTVATRNGAIPELVLDGVTGTVVTSGDVGALAEALLTYAEQPELRLAHGAAARVRALQRYHIDDCARAYLALFHELAKSRPGGALARSLKQLRSSSSSRRSRPRTRS